MLQQRYKPAAKVILCHDISGYIDGENHATVKRATDSALESTLKDHGYKHILRTMDERLFAARAEAHHTRSKRDKLFDALLDENTIVYLETAGEMHYRFYTTMGCDRNIETTGISAVRSLVENKCRATFVLKEPTKAELKKIRSDRKDAQFYKKVTSPNPRLPVYLVPDYSAFLAEHTEHSLSALAQRIAKQR